MALKTCAACGKEVEESDLFMSDKGEICAECDLIDSTASHEALEVGLLHPAIIIGLIAGIVPFFISVVESSATTEGGVVTESYLDYAALAGGGVAALAGIIFLPVALRAMTGKGRQIIAALIIVGLGALHLLRGFGVVQF